MSTNPLKRRLSPASRDEGSVFVSSPIHDRSSTFIAHFHPHGESSALSASSKPLSVTSIIKSFQLHPDFADADHRMVAWRRPSTQQTLRSMSTSSEKVIHTTGSDDDGERFAGKRLEKVLDDLDVAGTVVVARWYGGILLGPVRFAHIENVAKEAIQRWKLSQDDGSNTAKRHRGNDKPGPENLVKDDARDEAEHARLAKQLIERDSSIVVLRGLLADKKGERPKTHDGPSQTLGTSTPASTTSPAKQLNYGEMPLATLRKLDKARDATIAFILKQIDKVEEEQTGEDGTETVDSGTGT